MKFFHIRRIYGCSERGDGDSLYLTRITLIGFKSWSLNLHIFHRSDFARARHDHPFNFWTMPIWRGYIDETIWRRQRCYPGLIYYRPASHTHRVQLMNEKPAITLVLFGKRTRNWNFFTEQGIVPWQTYFAQQGCEP